MSAYEEISKILHMLKMEDFVKEDLEDAADHGELVSKIVSIMCDYVLPDGEAKKQIVTAAMLHDIGKLKLSKDLYGRDKNKLQIEEVKYMRMHAKLGYDMLTECGYDKRITEAVYYHHENYDGTGYPTNLSGTAIPASARIIKVCDVFAALISKRPYRDAFDKETAIEMMIEDNKDFDMRLFLIFMEMYHSEEFSDIVAFAKEINARRDFEDADHLGKRAPVFC